MSHIYTSWHDFYLWLDSSNVASLLFPATFVIGYTRYEHHRSRKHLSTLHDELKQHVTEMHNIHIGCLEALARHEEEQP
jgi:hypothetical protein